MGVAKKLRGGRNRKTRYREPDLDQVQEEFQKLKGKQPPPKPIDLDLPGGGQFECQICNRYFINDAVRQNHLKTKQHKKMLKLAQEAPYTIEEAEAAGRV